MVFKIGNLRRAINALADGTCHWVTLDETTIAERRAARDRDRSLEANEDDENVPPAVRATRARKRARVQKRNDVAMVGNGPPPSRASGSQTADV